MTARKYEKPTSEAYIQHKTWPCKGDFVNCFPLHCQHHVDVIRCLVEDDIFGLVSLTQ